jgi:hypothetical protein
MEKQALTSIVHRDPSRLIHGPSSVKVFRPPELAVRSPTMARLCPARPLMTTVGVRAGSCIVLGEIQRGRGHLWSFTDW